MGDIKVRSSSIVFVSNNGQQTTKQLLECSMSDGSIWFCELDGTNWRQGKLGDDELTKKFHENTKHS